MFQGASPKLTFIFGVVTGVAVTAVVAMTIFFTTGFTTSKTASTNTNTVAAAGDEAQTFGDVKEVSDDDYVLGKKDADLMLIAYTDLECPYCKRFHPVVDQVREEYGDKVAFVYRHFPLSFHANAQKEAEAALCVGDLGGTDKYWDFVNKIFERTTSNGTGFALTDLGPLAKEVGVSQDKFQSCLDGGDMADRVAAEMSDGTQAGATGTPTTFVVKDGKTVTGIPGAYTFDQVKAIVDSALDA